MKAVQTSIGLIIAAALPLACSPVHRLPISGEVKLEFIEKDASEIHFRLKNQTSKQVSFWGARDWWWESVFPMGPRFECALLDTDQVHESPLSLIDGPAWREFVIASGDAIDVVVDNYYLRGGDGGFPTGRCRLVLQLEGGGIVSSEGFESWGAADS